MEPKDSLTCSSQSMSQQVFIALENGQLAPLCASTFIKPSSQNVQSNSVADNVQVSKKEPSTSGVRFVGKRLADEKLDLDGKKRLKSCSKADPRFSLQSKTNSLKFSSGNDYNNIAPSSKLNSVNPEKILNSSFAYVDQKQISKALNCNLDKVVINENKVIGGEKQNLSEERGAEKSDNLLKTLVSSSKMNNLPKTHSPKYAYRYCKTSENSKVSVSKSKSTQVPLPRNLNQLGDCLKTRIGRYHYGLTLNDPPCQFFRGVLKGATGQTLAVLFGDTDLISKLEKLPTSDIGHFVMDNTLTLIRNSTAGVNQVLTISLLYQNQAIPLWYAITSCSSTELFKKIIIEFYQYVLDWPFLSFLLNDDPDLCRAVVAVFPGAELYGSWYHYCHSIWNEVRRNNLVELCSTNTSLLSALKMLFVVPFLPPPADTPSSGTMLDGLQLVRQLAQDQHLPMEFTNILDFVETFWFNTVKCENCSVFGENSKLINYIESSQLSLLSFMRPNGNVWTLTRAFQSLARTTNKEVTNLLEGKLSATTVAKKRNQGLKFVKIIHRNMKKLTEGGFDVKTFLEKSTIYSDKMIDIFLHPLQSTLAPDGNTYFHVEQWRIKIDQKD